MEVREIISSGLLELYAAGIASEKESREVEQYVAQYPEVAAELRTIAASLETYANEQSIIPSPAVKEKIFAQIRSAENAKTYNETYKTHVPVTADKRVIRMDPFWKYVAAASAILLLVSVVFNMITYNKYNKADQNYIATRERLTSLQEENRIMEEGMSVVQSKYSIPVALKGLEASPEAAAKIFWMENTGEVFIDPSNLPEAPQGKQYQLWGIVDGKPVDGGMILTSKNGDRYRIQKMKTFGKVEAFAVTLETESGNTTPKGPMYVMGKM